MSNTVSETALINSNIFSCIAVDFESLMPLVCNALEDLVGERVYFNRPTESPLQEHDVDFKDEGTMVLGCGPYHIGKSFSFGLLFYYYHRAYPACSACTVCLMQCYKSFLESSFHLSLSSAILLNFKLFYSRSSLLLIIIYRSLFIQR